MKKESVRLFHVFKHNSRYCLINIEEMYLMYINEAVAWILYRITKENNLSLDGEKKQILDNFDLIIKDNTHNEHRNDDSFFQ